MVMISLITVRSVVQMNLSEMPIMSVSGATLKSLRITILKSFKSSPLGFSSVSTRIITQIPKIST